LEKIGGFEAFVDYLADDYELGKRIADLGLNVELSEVVVETYLPAYSMREFFAHQLRWARGIRDSRAGGYFGLVFTFGVMWSGLLLLAGRGASWAWDIVGLTLLLRLAVACVVGKAVLEDRQLPRQLWLLPFRDVLATVIWIASFAGHTVTWRGDRFELKAGKLVPQNTIEH
jgi:ceramide glucosyltransferase